MKVRTDADFPMATQSAEAWKDFRNGPAPNTPAAELGNLARSYLMTCVDLQDALIREGQLIQELDSAKIQRKISPFWMPIAEAPKDGTKVDLWLHIYASPRSMGMSDSFRVIDCWFENGHWVHDCKGKMEPLCDDYVTHFARIAEPKP